MAASFEADAIDRAIDFGNPQDLRNLIAQEASFGDVDGFAAETLRLRQPLGDQVAHDHNRCAQQLRGSRASQTNRPGASYVHDGTGAYSRSDRSVIASGEDVG